jgi:uncharacterized membrane protein
VKRLPGTLRILGGFIVGLIALPFALEPGSSRLQFLIGYSVALAALFVLLHGFDALGRHNAAHRVRRK